MVATALAAHSAWGFSKCVGRPRIDIQRGNCFITELLKVRIAQVVADEQDSFLGELALQHLRDAGTLNEILCACSWYATTRNMPSFDIELLLLDTVRLDIVLIENSVV